MAECSEEAKVNHSDEKRQQFGNRYLTDPTDVYKHNAWDNVQWDEQQEEQAILKIKENSENPISENQRVIYEEEASNYWHDFYLQHQNRFFKDRHWLFTEFPELAPNSTNDRNLINRNSFNESNENSICVEDDYPGKNAHTKIFEVGCGVGNTVFPVLQTNSCLFDKILDNCSKTVMNYPEFLSFPLNDPGIHVYCCDFAESAIEIVKNHNDYDEKRCTAFVCDVSSDAPLFPFPNSSLDIIVLIFVLSAINPNKMQLVLNTLAKLLKPGGVILFRDYGRYDMAQLRFKKGKCLSDNFYVRGDGTRVYFFTQEELSMMFEAAGLREEQNHIDRRLQVNRGKQLKMYRIWIQCKYRKVIN